MMDAYWNASYSFDLSGGRHLITVLGLPPLPLSLWSGTCMTPHKKTSCGGCLHVLGSSVRIVSFCVCPGVSSTAHLCSSVCVFLSIFRKTSLWLLLFVWRRGLWLDGGLSSIPCFSMANWEPGVQPFSFSSRYVKVQSAESRQQKKISKWWGGFLCAYRFSLQWNKNIFLLFVLWAGLSCSLPVFRKRLVPQVSKADTRQQSCLPLDNCLWSIHLCAPPPHWTAYFWFTFSVSILLLYSFHASKLPFSLLSCPLSSTYIYIYMYIYTHKTPYLTDLPYWILKSCL